MDLADGLLAFTSFVLWKGSYLVFGNVGNSFVELLVVSGKRESEGEFREEGDPLCGFYLVVSW
jgi:hypothetical protein